MKNKARNAGVAVAAMMAVTMFGGAAHAATVLPPNASIDFGQVKIGDSVSAGILYNVSTTGMFVPVVNGLGTEFSYSLGACNLTSSCILNFTFTPTTTGPLSTVAKVAFNFLLGDESPPINVTVDLGGIGVVPIPGALPLFLSGLGGLAYLARPRRKTATA